MNALEYLITRKIVHPDKRDLAIRFDDGRSTASVVELMESYHQHKLKFTAGSAERLGPKEDKIYHNGFWNGEPARYRVVWIEVGPDPEELRQHIESQMKARKRYLWFVPFIGEKRQAIEVTYGKAPFFLDNKDGSGLYKVNRGHGSPLCFHRTVYPSREIGQVEDNYWELMGNYSVQQAELEIEDRWMLLDPDGYREHKVQIVALKEVIRKGFQSKIGGN